jgi:hypothetical protein
MSIVRSGAGFPLVAGTTMPTVADVVEQVFEGATFGCVERSVTTVDGVHEGRVSFPPRQ